MKKVPFCVATDGSNDGERNLYPIIVTYFKEESGEVQNNVLAVPILKADSTGENIANLVLQNLKMFNIPVKNCVGLVADNAPVMMGKKSGVFAVLQTYQENLIDIGCPCHLLNLAAEKGSACLSLNVDELLVDIFYYLQKSVKRKEKLKLFQQLHNSETKKILKHVCSRWLSLGKCLERLLSQWDPLVSFFKEEINVKRKPKDSKLDSYSIPKKTGRNPTSNYKSSSIAESSTKKRNSETAGLTKLENLSAPKKLKVSEIDNVKSILSREERLFYLLTNDVNKAFCLFLSYILPYFDKVNLLLQSKTPLIHKLKFILTDFFKQILSKFVRPNVVAEESSILSIRYHDIENQKDDADLLIGNETSIVVNNLKVEDKSVFFRDVRNFYVKICDYMHHKFPFNKEILKHAEVCNFNNFQNATFVDVKFFLEKFPVFLEACACSIDELQSEFSDLQMTKMPDNILNTDEADIQWVLISNYKNQLGDYPFKRIARAMSFILSIPHSNAECERVFSIIKKQKTEFRSSLSNETLENLLIMKCNLKSKCYEHEFDESFLSKAKSCTYKKNKF